MNSQHFLMASLARQCWIDGRQDGSNGMRAVAFVWRNRALAGWYGGDWAQLLSHANDYAATINPEPFLEVPDPRGFAFQQVLQDIDGIFNGTTADGLTIKAGGGFAAMDVGGAQVVVKMPGGIPVAMYYARLNEINNPWFLEKIARDPEHKRVAQIGTLVFFS